MKCQVEHMVCERALLPTALVLLSGGIDSATALYLVKNQYSEIYTMNMIYTQTYDSEAEASRRLANAAQVKEHLCIYLPFFKDLEKRYRPQTPSPVSSAYVPARNIVFYGVAAAYAEALGVEKIVFGSNADDAKELPDANSRFVELMNDLIRAGTKAGSEGKTIEIVNPLINYGKTEVLKLARKLEVPLQFTWSCYHDAVTPCGECRGCETRLRAFRELGMTDPLIYSESST